MVGISIYKIAKDPLHRSVMLPGSEGQRFLRHIHKQIACTYEDLPWQRAYSLSAQKAQEAFVQEMLDEGYLEEVCVCHYERKLRLTQKGVNTIGEKA